MSFDKQVASFDVSVALVDLDHSNERLTNVLFQSFTSLATVPVPAPPTSSYSSTLENTADIRVFCRSRRMELLRLPCGSIRDVRRRRAESTESGKSLVEVDFTSSPTTGTNTFSGLLPESLLSVVPADSAQRSFRAVFQVQKETQNDQFFAAMLAAWRLSQNTSINQHTQQQQRPSASGSLPHYPGNGSSSSAFSLNRTTISNSRIGSDLIRSRDQRSYQLVEDDCPAPAYVIDSQGAFTTVVPSHSQSVEIQNATEEETNRMLNTCAALESEIRAIQHRRRQRTQVLLMLEKQDVGLGSTSATNATRMKKEVASTSPSLRYFDTPLDAADIYDPAALNQSGFVTLCPHCGIHSSNSHRDTCPQRTVQCLRCRSNMKLKDFGVHASLCVNQNAAGNPNYLPHSTNTFLNGTAAPQQDISEWQRTASVMTPLLLSPTSTTASAPSGFPPSSGQAQTNPNKPMTMTLPLALHSPSKSSPASTPPEKAKALTERGKKMSFTDIPRVQSIIINKRQEKPASETPKVLRFAEDTLRPSDAAAAASEGLSSPRRGAPGSPRLRVTSFVDEPKLICPWCKKAAPEDHPRKCAERRVVCTLCNEEVFLRDKRDHRSVCLGARKANNVDGENYEDAVHDAERRLRKIESYRKRLEVLRKANEENGAVSNAVASSRYGI